ncbi:hypothetical protein HZB60_04545 [candidate division KSB1 bacterium]|nr:hypothetical protein [candidate division KSB1 bacterium]
MDPREEEELRNLVRRELESREQLRGGEAGERRLRVQSGSLSAERRRVIEEEIAAFYHARGVYHPYRNEDGETEWLTEEEVTERERQIPVDIEELEVGQRRIRTRVLISVGLAVVGLILLFVLLRDRTGGIQVISNVKGATVLLDGSATEYQTDAHLRHLPVGPHLISLAKAGFVADGEATVRVDLRPGSDMIVTLQMKLNPLETKEPVKPPPGKAAK